MLRSIAVAFATYSKIPMPVFEWEEKDLKYSMCAFPLVGLVLAIVQYGVLRLLVYLGVGNMLTAAVLTLVPFLYTGGIHMDGYMDTTDARCSYKDREKKLAILKDPHVGSFAVIHGVLYVMLTFALFAELAGSKDDTAAAGSISAFSMVFAGYVLSRILSAISVVTFKKAKEDGMLSDMSRAQDKNCRLVLYIMLVLFAVVGALLFHVYLLAVLVPATAVFACYRHFSYKQFGGITGDLAGWFLQICELSVLIFVTFVDIWR